MFQVHLERVTEEEQLWTHSTQQISKYRVTHSKQVVPFYGMSEIRGIWVIYILICIPVPRNRWLVQCIRFVVDAKICMEPFNIQLYLIF